MTKLTASFSLVCTENTLKQVEVYAKQIHTLVCHYKWIVESYVVEFYLKDHWGHLPLSWQDSLKSLTPPGIAHHLLSNQPSTGDSTTTIVWPLSLLAFRSATEALALKRNVAQPAQLHPQSGRNPDLSHCYRTHVKPKKQHEIERLAEVIDTTCGQLSCHHIVDIGSGQGHLSRLLSFGYGHHVTSIEAIGCHVTGAAKFDQEVKEYIQRKTRGSKQQWSVSPPCHVVCTVHPYITVEEFLSVIRAHTQSNHEGHSHLNSKEDQLENPHVKKLKIDLMSSNADKNKLASSCSCSDHQLITTILPQRESNPSNNKKTNRTLHQQCSTTDQSRIQRQPGEPSSKKRTTPSSFNKMTYVHSKTESVLHHANSRSCQENILIPTQTGTCKSKSSKTPRPSTVDKLYSSSHPKTESANCNSYQECSTTAQSLIQMQPAEPINSSNERFLVTGLHTCGDLGPTMLRTFAACPSAVALASVACCYMRMSFCDKSSSSECTRKSMLSDSEQSLSNPFHVSHQGSQPDVHADISSINGESILTEQKPAGLEVGFPMSRYVESLCQENQTVMTFEPLELACHFFESYKTRLKDNDPSLLTQGYRSALEVLIQEECIDLTRSQDGARRIRKAVGSVKRGHLMTFEEYATSILTKLGLQSHPDRIRTLGETLLPRWHNLLVYHSIRQLLAPVVESLVLVDRTLFLIEKGIESSLVPIFDPLISPRNLVLLAVKKPR